MGTHTVHRTSVPTARAGSDYGRQLLTIVGGAALVVAAFLNWTRNLTGVTLSNHSLIKTEFAVQTDVVRTVGGVAVVIGLVGMFGLMDRTGWLTRLCGLLGIALFVMFTIEVYRSSVHTMQPGAWLGLGGSVLLLIGGFLRTSGAVSEPMAVEERGTDRDQIDPRGYGMGTGTGVGTDVGAGTETDIGTSPDPSVSPGRASSTPEA